MMNPFDLAGPQFLIFFSVLAAGIAVLLWMLCRGPGRDALPVTRVNDPYRIAYLRGGKEEAARVATLVLVDRDLLKAEGTVLTRAENVDMLMVEDPLERWVLRSYGETAYATSIFSDPGLGMATAACESDLTRLGLLPDAARKQWHLSLFAAGALFLIGVVVSKIVIAAGRGHVNVFFLLVLCGLSILLAWKITHRFRTERGDALLADLRRLFAGLRARKATLQPHAATAEVALFAAVFGLSELAGTNFDYVHKLYPRAKHSGSSCGGGCGASCGGGGGGSCGGGCGGCGS